MNDEWTDAYSIIMPMLGFAVAVVGLSFSLLQMQRSQAISGRAPTGSVDVEVPRVHYRDGEILVEVREPGEWREVREFVRPDDTYLTHAIMRALSG